MMIRSSNPPSYKGARFQRSRDARVLRVLQLKEADSALANHATLAK
jgi:hypothetical protein